MLPVPQGETSVALVPSNERLVANMPKVVIKNLSVPCMCVSEPNTGEPWQTPFPVSQKGTKN